MSDEKEEQEDAKQPKSPEKEDGEGGDEMETEIPQWKSDMMAQDQRFQEQMAIRQEQFIR